MYSKRRDFLLGTAGTLAVLASPRTLHAQTRQDTLIIGTRSAATSADPHYANTQPNIDYASHVFEKLVERDEHSKPTNGGLAESWKLISDTVWEFKLRPNVRWHDGKPFSAEDVEFTLKRVPNIPGTPGGFASYINAISKIEIIDPLTVRLHTSTPYANLPRGVGTIYIVSRHVGEGAKPEDYNTGRAAIGTGPYRYEYFKQNEEAGFVRNDDYWDRKAPWARVRLRTLANDSTRIAALLAGDIDMADQIPTSDIAHLKTASKVSVDQIDGMRSIFLFPNVSRDTDMSFIKAMDGSPLPHNPLRDLRVRQALSLSIDRKLLVDRLMNGGAAANGQWIPAGAYSYNPEIPVPQANPQEARRLLAEAGYPQGFRITLHSPNDRYPNDARVAQAIGQMWTRAGLAVDVAVMPYAVFAPRARKQEFAIHLIGWGNSAGDASTGLMNVVGTYNAETGWGVANEGRYSNPKLDAMTAKALATMDDQSREQQFKDAVKVAVDDLAILPLYQVNPVWAVRKGLRHHPRADERTSAIDMSA
ncbi:ABC transporter substrate-binding protein [Achromobacter aloeverae]|uniref:ABC transporter substrate-binding protein n=1 Tax=Achromobacter aloeverae TaxID=1750518 RepID=A0A4Q1HFK0_9BURK|nr:ABC transporter substrate-binding protein [Achromobacter aloeverae]RXN85338.1 ABC transporter substrate-binding protein [Achromobacter aloeverae]